jgi:PAS domain S-box-containing protein
MPKQGQGQGRGQGQGPGSDPRELGLYRSAFRQAALGMALLTPTGDFLAANRHLAEMLGYSEHELTSRGLAEYTHPEDRLALAFLLEQMREQGVRAAQREMRLSHRFGHLVWALMKCTLAPAIQGQPPHLVCLFLDVTRQRQAEAALLESEEKYRTIFETSGSAMLIIEEDTRVSLANSEFMALTGASREALERQPSWTGYIAAEDVPRMLAYHKLRRTDPRTAPRSYETRVIDAQGKPRPCLATVGVIPGTSRSVASLLDLTELKRAEAERIRLEEDLRQAQKMEAIGTLAGGVAHDFNNILASILGFTQIALHDLLEPGHPAAHALEQVVTACRRARDLAGQILTFSRRSPERQRPLELLELVDEALQLVRASLPSTIEIRRQVAPTVAAGGWVVMGDPTQLHQVLLNLCTNAAQAMGVKGGVLGLDLDLAAMEDPSPVWPPELIPGCYLVLTVSDTGPGMEPEVMERIFEPYFTTKAQGEGTGLGLAVVHGIVKAHRGTVQVRSIPGRGSLFRVFLPLAQGEGLPLPAPAVNAGAGRGERILLVDDEPAVVEMASTMLANLGYRVRAFTDAGQALDAFLAAPGGFDLVITDQTMPRMTGAELARALLGLRPGLPVILCSGFAGDLGPGELEAIGVRRFLAKPIERQDLASCVRQALDAKPEPRGWPPAPSGL